MQRVAIWFFKHVVCTSQYPNCVTCREQLYNIAAAKGGERGAREIEDMSYANYFEHNFNCKYPRSCNNHRFGFVFGRISRDQSYRS